MISVDPKKCDFCGVCVAVCPVDAIEVLECELAIDESTCTCCLNCVVVCPWAALGEDT